ncbi:transporter, monovalent cation:proton antiporter-2 (CPA2) family [Hyphomonas neptunium ATCC 15444]|uniref:Transporter, monovalent cation:proton antiporter-2 (CPA2) family n=1 Tax=Hyphomonas neptunium (strain ATCC 15444) TaxID=228405 RepID=Q0C5P6_HYPNA|nr:transporter, monovalent cation:proton antiporter-2 (CPA2) family [Hyphomonas neptunium ATCC 15444]
MALAALTSLVSQRFGAPLLLVFLGIGLLAGEDGLLGIQFDSGSAAYFIGSLALAIILFDSGFETPMRSYKVAAAPALSLATFGVVLTAGLTGVAAHFLFGVGWLEAFLLGSIVASTDAAAVFFLLRAGGIRLREKVGSTLEIESGANDPMAIFLTILLIELIVADAGTDALFGFEVLMTFVQQMGLGILFGIVGGFGISWFLHKLVNVDPGLYPISGLAAALVVFSVCALLGGSGFLAAYVAGVVAGNRKVKFAHRLRRFQVGMTWLAQIGMFLALGLLATPSEFPRILVPALILAGVLIFVARPLAVWLCLLPFDFRSRETLFTGWVGLRGAVSILLAILPGLAGIENGSFYFNVVFVMVLVSLLVQGWTIQPAAKLLKMSLPSEQGLVDRVELELRGATEMELVGYKIHPDSAIAKGERVPRWARPVMVIRDGLSYSVHTIGPLQANDQVYLFASARRVRLLDQIYASPWDEMTVESDIQFRVKGATKMSDLVRQYGLEGIDTSDAVTASQFLDRSFDGKPVLGDRVTIGDVDIVVCALDDAGGVGTVGIVIGEEDPGAGALMADLVRRGGARIAGLVRRPKPISAGPAESAPAKDIGDQA